MAQSEQRIEVLNGMRGYAILLVVFFHYFKNGLYTSGFHINIFGFPFYPLFFISNGWLGVNLFFIISGFVLFLPYATGKRSISSFQSFLDFYLYRAKRLFPLFFFSSFLLLSLLPSPVIREKVFDLFLAFTLNNAFFPSSFFPIFNIVLWSLSVEWWFSLIFPFIVLAFGKELKNKTFLIIYIFTLIFRGIFAFTILPSHPTFSYFFSNIFVRLDDFVLGMLLCDLYVHGWKKIFFQKYPRLTFISGLFLVFLAIYSYTFLPKLGGFFMFLSNILHIGVALLLLSLLFNPSGVRHWFFSNYAVQLIGMMCYSIYIWHYVIYERSVQNIFSAPQFVAYLLLTGIVSFLSYRFIEFGNKSLSDILPNHTHTVDPSSRPQQEDMDLFYRSSTTAIPSSPYSREKKGTISCFDFDGTITDQDSFLSFLIFLLQKNVLTRKELAIAVLSMLHPTVIFRREAMKQRFLRTCFSNTFRGSLAEHGSLFASTALLEIIRPSMLRRIEWHRAQGHRCILISATFDFYLEPWARSAGFEAVLASSLATRSNGMLSGEFSGKNCRGEEKVSRLQTYLGNLRDYEIYAYGDSSGDKALLRIADHAFYRKTRFDSDHYSFSHSLIKLLRPHQWIKNSFVLAGILFSHAWMQPFFLGRALLMAAAFCAISSATYIVNDAFDRARDRLHPTKKERPLALGVLSLRTAYLAAAFLFLFAIGVSSAISIGALAIVLGYFLLTLAYSLRFKHVVLLDVFILASGFLLRILAGTIAIGITPSNWLILCGFMLSLFLGFAKRSAELSRDTDASRARAVLSEYSPQLLASLLTITAAATILCYSLYTVSAETLALHGTSNLLYTVPLVAYGIFRTLYLLQRGVFGHDIASEIPRDRHLVLVSLFWIALSLFIIS